MEQVVQQILVQIRATWRQRWWILPIAWLVCVGGWLFVHSLPDVYASNARVFVNTQTVLDPLLRGMTVRPDTEQRVRMMTRTLLSQENLELIARQSDLDVLTGNPSIDSHVSVLRSGIDLSTPRGRENIYSVSFRHGNPEVAYRVVQETVNLFMERGLGDTRLDLTTSQQFIERQLENFEAQLRDRESEIEQFKRDNVAYLRSGGDFYTRLDQARDQLAQAELELRESERSMDTFARRLREAEASGTTMSEYENPELDRRIDSLEVELDSLRLRYTDRHPDVIATQRALTDLRERREREALAFAENPTLVAQGGAPTLESMRFALAESESRVAALRIRVHEFGDRVARLEAVVDRVPAVESEFTALTRNYEVLKRSYNELLESRERALLTGEVEMQTDAVDFRVLDPPRRPEGPSSPDRPLLASAVLLLGLGAGTGFAFLLAQLRGTVHDGRHLAEITGRPVLGYVTWVQTARTRRRRVTGLIIFSIGLLGLLSVFGAVVAGYLIEVENVLDRVQALIF